MTTTVAGLSRPATLSRRVFAQSTFEARAVLRNGEQVLLTLGLPLAILLLAALTPILSPAATPAGRLVDAAPGALAVAIFSATFTSQAILTAFDRRSGVLRLLAVTPLGGAGMLFGKALAVIGILGTQTVVLGAVAAVLGWTPRAAGFLVAALAVPLASVAFVSLALLTASVLRAEATLAIANLVWLVLVVGGGLIYPPDRLPGVVGTIAGTLPTGALGELLRTGFADGTVSIGSLLVLIAWATGLAALCARYFRWS